MEIDDINLSIIKHLKDGRKSFSAIAKSLSITENTVRARTRKMKEEGLLKITSAIDPEKLPGHSIAFIGVKLKTMELVAKGKELSNLRGVISVSVVTGRYDIILIIMLNDDFGLFEFYTQEMTKVSDVLSSETFVAYNSYNLNLPYIL